jgi:PAS domain S-box-containing protein
MKQDSPVQLVTWGFRIAGGTAALIGGFWLVAWLLGWAARWSAGGVIIPKTNMALCQLLGGIALLLLGQSTPFRSRRVLGAALALFMLLVGALTFGEHLFGFDLGIDQLLATEAPGAAATASPNRMGPIGAASLILSGAGFLALAWRRRRLAPYLGLVVFTANLVPAIGFLYGVAEFFSLPRLTGIAWPTVVALLALGGGLMLTHREGGRLALLLSDDAGGALLRKMLPGVILVPLALGFLRVHIHALGLVDTATGTGLLVIALVLVFSFVLWRSAEYLSRTTAAEEAGLRESRKKYQDLIETTGDFIWETDSLGRYTYCSPQIEKLWGLKAEEMIGKTPFDLMPSDLKSRTSEAFADFVGSPRAFSGLELASYDGQGRLMAIEVSGVPFFDQAGVLLGFRGISRDISKRKRAEEELARSNQKLAQVLDSIQDDFYVLDHNWVFVYASRQFTLRIGKEPKDFIGNNIWKMFPKNIGTVLEENFRATMEKREIRRFEMGGRYTDAWYSMTSFPSPEGITVLGREITDRKRAEEALRESETRFRQLADASFEGLVIHEDGLMLDVNERVTDMLGYAREQLMGNAFWKYIDVKYHDLVKEKVRQWSSALYEVELIHMDGRHVPVEVMGRSLTWQGRRVRAAAFRDISERKRAEEALRQSEEKHRTIVETANEGIITVDAESVTTYVNATFANMLGFSPEELIGKEITEHFAKEHLALVLAKREERRQSGARGSFEVKMIRRDGSPVWVMVNASPLLDKDGKFAGWLGMVTDITEQKRTEALRQALAEQERLRLGAAVEQASDAVVMVDLDGTIQYVNAAFESMMHTPRDKAIGRSYLDFLAGGSSMGGAIREAIALGRPWHGPLGGPAPGGSTIELDVTISPATGPSGKLIGGLITERDVTQANALQQHVRQAQKMEALGTLAGGITHDFNNLLGAIILNTELAILDLDPTHPARWPLPLVLQAANRGKELVKQIITFSRQRAWERKPLEIVPIVKEGMKLLRSTLPKNIAIHEAIDAGSGVVLADPSHVHQILVNLCQNAGLAMADGTGRIEVGLRPVEVDAAFAARHPELKPGPFVRLTVADSGCGMTPEIMERIFEPFFTTRKHGEGSGLGLAVVQGIVKSYDGTVTVSSEPGRGSVFDVYIPRLEGEALATGSAEPLQPARGRERILLIEDEAAQRTSLTRGLERLGYKVTARADGRTALAAFRKKPSAFDLVITDQIMPKMSGLELAKALVKLRPDIPIILCTGFSEKVDGGTVGQKGIHELVMKPFTIQEITRAIRAALKK